MSDKSKPGFTSQAILIVALGFMAMAFAYSIRAVLSLAMPVWESELAWSRGAVSNVAAITLLIMAVIAPLSGILLDRKGLRFTLLVGLVGVSATCFLVSVSTNVYALLISFGVIGGIGFGIVSTHIMAAASARLFPGNVGLASGIATSGSTAGQFLIVPLVAVALTTYSWQWAFVLLGVGTAVMIPLVWWLPDDQSNASNESTNSLSENWRDDLRTLVRSPVFHLLFWSFLICGYTTSGVIETHLLPYAQYCGFGPVPSATAYGLLSAVNLVGMICVGWLTDRMNRPLLLGAIYLIRGFTFWFLLSVGTSYEHLLLFAVIFGIVDYSTVPVTTSLVASHLGLRTAGFVMGLLTAGHQLGAAIGASLGGFIFSWTQAYDLVWISSIVLAALAGLMVLAVRDSPRIAT